MLHVRRRRPYSSYLNMPSAATDNPRPPSGNAPAVTDFFKSLDRDSQYHRPNSVTHHSTSQFHFMVLELAAS